MQGPDLLFCYGTLQFDAVLTALLGRIPERAPASAPGYRAAALEGCVYPGLVIHTFTGSVPGVILTDLTDEEWRILDAFEDERYDLRATAGSDTAPRIPHSTGCRSRGSGAGSCGWLWRAGP
ncbi:gamma-glutamylcyclotransferase family protein, partial [Streptomyces shenzhenensis]|uniref:gamma-glutamylcyclotransferase family protein n=1 Tax=Streptomyces shenzhenensis TaxID=943815 RepID=UPI00340FE293